MGDLGVGVCVCVWNIKMIRKEVFRDCGLDSSRSRQVQWLFIVNAVMKLQVP
jgi:hypothetical protein